MGDLITVSNHAGFGSVVVLKQALLQNVLRIYHNVGLIPTNLNGTEIIPDLSAPGAEPTRVSYNLYLDLPRLTLSAARPGEVGAAIRLIGPVTFEPPGGDPVVRQVLIEATVYTRPQIINDGGTIRAGLSFAPSSIAMGAISARVIEGPPLPENLHQQLNSDFARILIRERLNMALGLRPLPMTPGLFETITSRLRDLGLVLGSIQFKVFDGALGVGLNVTGMLSPLTISTSGDWDQLHDFTGTSSLAASVNPGLAAFFFAAGKRQLQEDQRRRHEERVQERRNWEEARRRGENVPDLRQGPEVVINEINFQLEASNVRIWGNASSDGIAADFSLRMRPRVSGSRLYIDLYDVEIRLPWWVHLIAALSLLIPFIGPIITMILLAVGDSIRWNVARSTESGVEATAGTNRTQTFTLPGTMYPPCNLRTDNMTMGSAGMDAWANLGPDWGSAAHIVGPTSLVPETLAPVTYRLVTPGGLFNQADPTVRVRWEVRRLDTSAIVLSRDTPVQNIDSAEIHFNPGDPGLIASWGYTIYCRLYRTWAATAEELFSGSVALRIHDRLNRSQPYVRWQHGVYTPEVLVTNVGGRRVLHTVGYNSVSRNSKIHRTALPGRCRFADQFSMHVKHVKSALEPGAANLTYLEYLNELPFPVSELANHRREVCDYCFYGGPDKSVPLI